MKTTFGIVAIGITFYAYIPYIWAIHRGTIKPHMFSWVIWGVTTLIVFFAQLQDKGGIGAWPIGISGIITLITAVLAYKKKSDDSITRTDWFFLQPP